MKTKLQKFDLVLDEYELELILKSLGKLERIVETRNEKHSVIKLYAKLNNRTMLTLSSDGQRK